MSKKKITLISWPGPASLLLVLGLQLHQIVELHQILPHSEILHLKYDWEIILAKKRQNRNIRVCKCKIYLSFRSISRLFREDEESHK